MPKKHEEAVRKAIVKACDVLIKKGIIKEEVLSNDKVFYETILGIYQEKKKLTDRLKRKWGESSAFTIWGAQQYYQALIVIAYAKAIEEGREQPTEDDINWAHLFLMQSAKEEFLNIFFDGEELEAYYVMFVKKPLSYVLGNMLAKPSALLFITNKRIFYWNRNLFSKLSSPFAPSKVYIPLNEDELVTKVCGISWLEANTAAVILGILTNQRIIGIHVFEDEFVHYTVPLCSGEEVITQLARYPYILFLTTSRLVFFNANYSITGSKIRTTILDRRDKSVKVDIQQKRGFFGGTYLTIGKEKNVIKYPLITEDDLNTAKEIERMFHL